MAARKLSLPAASKERGVLAANVYDHATSAWYGPSYAENGPPPAELAGSLPPSVWDVRANWPTRQDAEAVGLAWPDDPEGVVADASA